MANFVLKGVYASKSALDTAELATASDGDSYLVGSKSPYDSYTYSASKTAFQKGEKVGRKEDFDITIDDVTEDIPVSDLYNIPFKGADGKTLKIRKGLHLGEIHFYVPAED